MSGWRGAFVLVAFGGFIPTYWAPVAAGTFKAPPVIHIHGFLMFSWTVFFLIQTALAAAGRTRDHRSWGLAGTALFSVIACAVLVGETRRTRLQTTRYGTGSFLAYATLVEGSHQHVIGAQPYQA